MKRKHRPLSIVLTICLLVGMLPITALAAETEYDLWVGGVQVTDANKDGITAAIGASASGSATFDPATNTLTLDGFSYAGTGYTFDNNTKSAAIYSGLGTLNITVNDTNSLSHSAADHSSYGIYTEGNLVFTEQSTGELTIQGAESTNNSNNGIFLNDGNLTVNGGMVIGNGGNSSSTSAGVWCFNGDITVNANAKLTGNGGDGRDSYGICAFGKLAVNGGMAEGMTGTGMDIARGITAGTVESSNENSIIAGTAGDAKASAGIYIWNPAVFSNGSMKGISNASTGNQSYGIFMDNDDPNDKLTISGGTVIGEGLNGAFNKSPVIDPAFIDAGIWYGDTETDAETLGVQLTSSLASNYNQKYVRIDPTPLFDASVSPANLSLTEGTIHKDSNAKLTASYVSTNPNNLSVSYTYQWYSCDENGGDRTAVGDDDNIDNEYHISEELVPGTYYYVCEVSGYDYDSDFVASVSTEVVKVLVGAGTPVVIFDPDFGSFAEIGRVTIELPISNGKLTRDVPRPAAEGYVFKGWYTKDGERISDPANDTFDHTTRLYARYSKIYTATFDANGGVFSDGSSQYSVKFTDDALDKDKVPADPTREGREFLGWYHKDDEGNEHKLKLPPGQDYYELIGDFYFYAKWSEFEQDDISDTGDNSQTGLWFGLMMISLVGITACVIARCRKTIK